MKNIIAHNVKLPTCPHCDTAYGKWIVLGKCDKCFCDAVEIDDADWFCDDEGNHYCRACATQFEKDTMAKLK